MAFDITPYVDMSPKKVRELIRKGVIDFPTAGMCRGYAQANLVILPPEYAADFEEFAHKNPFPCPILEIIKGTPETHDMGEGGNICTDIPKYRIYENGVFTKEITDASEYWKEGYVGFLIGCSFSFEEALIREGIEIRHIAQGRNVPMFKTNIQTVPVGPFSGPMVCSMRPMTPENAKKAYDITFKMPNVHGAPVHMGAKPTPSPTRTKSGFITTRKIGLCSKIFTSQLLNVPCLSRYSRSAEKCANAVPTTENTICSLACLSAQTAAAICIFTSIRATRKSSISTAPTTRATVAPANPPTTSG